MTRWPDKYVIGLTGNIASGKSLIRKMLEHLGAFGIDADGLTAMAMSKGAPAYQPILSTFGTWLLDDTGEIDRDKLGRLVFSDPGALARLEAIVHPTVSQAIDTLIGRAKQLVVVVEAIKLLETTLAADCDAVWVVDAPEDLRLKRLVDSKAMSEADARQRIAAQGSQTDKLARADVVVKNAATFAEPWAQVQREWVAVVGAPPAEEPAVEIDSAPQRAPAAEPKREVIEAKLEVAEETAASVREVAPGKYAIERGGPGDAETIADFLNMVRKDGATFTRDDIMLAFGQKAYFLASSDDDVVGLAGWQVENLITTVDEFYWRDGIAASDIVASLIEHVEQASAQLQSEIAMLFLSNDMPNQTVQLFIEEGYEPSQTEDLKVLVWRQAATDLQPPNTRLLTKRLREDRVLKPI